MMDLLIDRYQTSLYSLCLKLTRNRGDADDLFQDTWTAALRRLDSFSQERPLRAWLFAICINRYRDAYRRRRRRQSWLRSFGSAEEQDRLPASAAGHDSGPEQDLQRREEREAVKQAIGRLDDDLRLAVLLHYGQGMSMDEVGGVLEIPAGTVKSRLFTARKQMKVWLEARGHA
ncbi:MAG: sigma-70 family RNA polymerase sigma factor [Candidatus Eisenbacteria bacterium]|nr:sigma-70 family RNA polymerase sigma factor [Candidatus Eisenbacteria bacterium]